MKQHPAGFSIGQDARTRTRAAVDFGFSQQSDGASFSNTYHIAYCLSDYPSLFAGLYTVFQFSTASVKSDPRLREFLAC